MSTRVKRWNTVNSVKKWNFALLQRKFAAQQEINYDISWQNKLVCNWHDSLCVQAADNLTTISNRDWNENQR